MRKTIRTNRAMKTTQFDPGALQVPLLKVTRVMYEQLKVYKNEQDKIKMEEWTFNFDISSIASKFLK